MTPVVIYHGTCADGFMAALAFWMINPDWQYHAATYGPGLKLPNDIDGRHVYLVDFCYPPEMMEELADRAEYVVVLDHHKSAMIAMKDFERDNVELHFDMDQSGAGMAWRYLTPSDVELPELVLRVEDRDLWRFKYEDTRDVQACVFSYPYEFEVWAELLERPIEDLAQEGAAIMRKHMKDVHEWIDNSVRRINIAGYNVPALNVPYQFGSEAGNILARGEPFAAIYFDMDDGRRWSLRSSYEGVDVSEIAKMFGGGGHKNASGFSTSYEWFGD